jgi:hypothetical protein
MGEVREPNNIMKICWWSAGITPSILNKCKCIKGTNSRDYGNFMGKTPFPLPLLGYDKKFLRENLIIFRNS